MRRIKEKPKSLSNKYSRIT